MNSWRARLLYLIGLVMVIPLGLGSRRYGDSLPDWFAEYGGDTLWAVMVFLLLSLATPTLSVVVRAGSALAFSYAIEFSQLYHAPWIDEIRDTTLGGLVLGFGFLWSDILCYTVGIGVCVLAELIGKRLSSYR